MELMDLPTWLRLNKAVCNKVSVKVSEFNFDCPLQYIGTGVGNLQSMVIVYCEMLVV